MHDAFFVWNQCSFVCYLWIHIYIYIYILAAMFPAQCESAQVQGLLP